MNGRSVRVLHISDLHMRSVDGPQAERARLEAASRWRILGEKWVNNLAELRREYHRLIWSTASLEHRRNGSICPTIHSLLHRSYTENTRATQP